MDGHRTAAAQRAAWEDEGTSRGLRTRGWTGSTCTDRRSQRTLAGLTLDSGALIAHESNQPGLMEAGLKVASERKEVVTVPTVVIAETWPGGPRAARIAMLLRACRIEPLDEQLAKKAAELRLGLDPTPSAVD